MKKRFIVLIHFLIVILSWTSWLWLKWDIIALISLIHIVMQETSDGCFLSHAQFGNKDTTFYEWWMGKIGIKIKNRKKMKIFMRYYIPLILVVLGIIYQEVFNVMVVDLFR